MNDDELKNKVDQAKYYFRRRWPTQTRESVDEFASFCAEQWLGGRDPRTSYDYLIYDYFKRIHNHLKHDRIHKIYEPAQSVSDIEKFELFDIIKAKTLTPAERANLILFYRWGLSEAEIGYCFGHSESMASFVKRDAIKKVLKYKKFSESK